MFVRTYEHCFLKNLWRSPSCSDKCCSRARTLRRSAGGSPSGGSRGPCIWVVGLWTFEIRSLRCTASCGRTHRNGYYPNKTIGRWSSRICICIRWNPFRAFYNFSPHLPRLQLRTYHTPAPLFWNSNSRSELLRNLSCRRSKGRCICSTDNMTAFSMRILVSRRRKRHPTSLASDPYEDLQTSLSPWLS